MTAAAAAASSSRSYKGKAPIICISSDDAEEDDESEDEEEEEEEEETSECEPDEEPQSEEEIDEDDCVSEEDEDEDEEEEEEEEEEDDDVDIDDDDHVDDDDDDSKVKPTDEDHCNKIINLLRGDVCRGDVVLFKQRVYEKFDIVKRGGGAKIIGKRVIAGRVVNESYGDAKQQHTFSIDVLWSKGVNPLPELFPLLVKGRNLYRLQTFRQPWSNEADRSRVLAEKHNRGAAARHVRAIAKTVAVNKGNKLRKRKRLGTKMPPNKKRRPDLELASRKRKKECAKKSSNCHANTRNAAMASKAGPSATHSQAKAGKAVKRRKSGPSSSLVHAKSSTEAKTKHSNPSATLPKQPMHHANGVQRGYQYPQRFAYYNNNHPPAEGFHTNSMAIPQENRGMHHYQVTMRFTLLRQECIMVTYITVMISVTLHLCMARDRTCLVIIPALMEILPFRSIQGDE